MSLFPVLLVPALDDLPVPASIQGEKYCAQFESEPRGIQYLQMDAVTAFAAGAVMDRNGLPVAVNASPGYALQWLSNYCHVNPMDKFGKAVWTMRRALEKDPKMLDPGPPIRLTKEQEDRLYAQLGLRPPRKD